MKLLLASLMLIMLAGCAAWHDDKRLRSEQAAALGWAVGMDESILYGYPPPMPSGFYDSGPDYFTEALRPRPRVNCMQYGTLGHGGQWNCW